MGLGPRGHTSQEVGYTPFLSSGDDALDPELWHFNQGLLDGEERGHVSHSPHNRGTSRVHPLLLSIYCWRSPGQTWEVSLVRGCHVTGEDVM